MRRDITRETLTAAIEELGSREAVAERFSINIESLRYFAHKYDCTLPEVPMTGRNGEMVVNNWLRNRGYESELTSYHSPFDLRCNGKRVEVKCAKYCHGEWVFNIHRKGVLNESEVDVYIFRLEQVPDSKAAIHLILPAPIGITTIKMTLRSLLTRYGQYFNKFELLNS